MCGVKIVTGFGWSWGIPRPMSYEDWRWVIGERLRRRLLRYRGFHTMNPYARERLLRSLTARVLEAQ